MTTTAEQIEQLRALHPEKGPYGGSGWANYAAVYFRAVCARLSGLLRHRIIRAFAVLLNPQLTGFRRRPYPPSLPP